MGFSDFASSIGNLELYIGRGDAKVREPIVVVRERPARWKRLRAWEIGLAPESS